MISSHPGAARVLLTALACILALSACVTPTSVALPTDPPTTAPTDPPTEAPTDVPATATTAATATEAAEPALSALEFRRAMNRLWEDHITWTRAYIVSVAHDLPDQEQVAARLLQNQTDIGDAIKPFYGEDAGSELTQLLEDHIVGAVDLLAAAKAGDTAAVGTASTAWDANGAEIAAFLSAANPDNWPLDAMQAGMQMHLDLTLEEATARLNGDYEADIAAYDKVHDHILELSGLLSDGIIAQFPEKFDESTLEQPFGLYQVMDKLWEDHITWTRAYIVSVAHDLPDQEQVAARLLQNQTDIGDAIKPFYGEDAGSELTQLLEDHIVGAVDLLAAAKAGDTAAVGTASTAWDANGAEIAAFLSAANPDNWPLDAMQAGMQMHLDLTLEEATARLNGDYEADIAAYDKVHDHILELSGLLSAGLADQFPDEAAQVVRVTSTSPATEAATEGAATQAATSAATSAATTAPTTARTTAATQAATTAATATTRPTSAFMTLQDFEFVPPQLTIPVGTTVVFLIKSAAGVCHGPYSSFPDSQDPSGLFDSGNLFEGQQYSFRFTQPGTITVRCGCHPFMVGTIQVTP